MESSEKKKTATPPVAPLPDAAAISPETRAPKQWREHAVKAGLVPAKRLKFNDIGALHAGAVEKHKWTKDTRLSFAEYRAAMNAYAREEVIGHE